MERVLIGGPWAYWFTNCLQGIILIYLVTLLSTI
jgi:hypothetical protein